jgi:hypothetical protein
MDHEIIPKSTHRLSGVQVLPEHKEKCKYEKYAKYAVYVKYA